MFVKMKNLEKKRSLNSSWERPCLFVKYLDGNGLFNQNERYMWSRVKMNNFAIAPKGIFNCTILHLEGWWLKDTIKSIKEWLHMWPTNISYCFFRFTVWPRIVYLCLSIDNQPMSCLLSFTWMGCDSWKL